MKRTTATLLLVMCVAVMWLFRPTDVQAQEALEIDKEALTLYQDAIDLKRSGNASEAIVAYEKALRKDRAVLAEDDCGLIDALVKHYQARIAKDPKDAKALETCGFINAVCFSDYAKAVEYYQKVIALVTDERVKEKTNLLIQRLQGMAQLSSESIKDQAMQRREEQLKSWAEMERQDKLAAQTEGNRQRAEKLAGLYKSREELEARIPQLEDEVKNLKEEYDKANRLWYSLKDDLYYRRRRRLEDDLDAKRKELDSAKAQFQEANSGIQAIDNTTSGPEQGGDLSGDGVTTPPLTVERPDNNDNRPKAPPSNDYGKPTPPAADASDPPLPTLNNMDFPGN